jgi:hypothetical protein
VFRFSKSKKLKQYKTMKKQSYDLMGDIHGQAPELERLLEKLSYKKFDGVWKHTERKMIFLGDFVDRGDYQKEVINIVRPMIEQGHALSVMGNHEYNAIAYYTKDKDGNYLRSHNNKHLKQHQKFLAAYENDSDSWNDVINWFKTLPLWLDLDGLRVVHACWDFNLISKLNSSKLTDDLLQQSAITGTWQNDAIETVLKGKEIPLPDGQSFPDKDNNIRHHIRIRWWDKLAKTYKEYFMGPDNALTHIPDDPVIGDHLIDYAHDDKPVFLGHYWMKGEIKPLADNIACLDYSVADAKDPNARLVAYRWDGEQKIDKNKFMFVERKQS